jgi:hypothetical protein
MAQAVYRRPVTTEVRIRSRATPCEICCGQSDIGMGSSSSTSVFPSQFQSIDIPYPSSSEYYYRDADKSLARPSSRCILFDG